jgi:hypothetical protein
MAGKDDGDDAGPAGPGDRAVPVPVGSRSRSGGVRIER